MLDDQSRDIKEHMSSIIKPLTAQVTLTNGKVAEVIRWKERVNGAILVLAFILPTLIGFVGWMAYEVSHLDEKIDNALSEFEAQLVE